jgi:hypothetical protein
MQAMLKLLRKWDPIVYLDLHVTDGAQFRHQVAVLVNPSLKGPEALQKAALKLSEGIQKDLAEFHAVPFYPSFAKDETPESGFEVGISPPRFSQSFWGLHSRIGILVETHSWEPYARRVQDTRATLLSVIENAVRD